MKTLTLTILAFVILLGLTSYQAAGSSPVESDCTFKGKRLYGKVQVVSNFPDLKVQVVSSFPDLKVQVVSSFPDLNVQVVNSFPDSCGKWQFVNSFPDIKIKMVNSFPGVN